IEIVDAEDAKPERDLGENRIQVWIESLFGDRKISHAHRREKGSSERQKNQRRLHWHDFERTETRELIIRLQVTARRIDDRLDGSQLRANAVFGRRLVLIGKFQLIGCVDESVEVDGLDWRSFQAQRLRAIAGLAAYGLHHQLSRQGFRVVLQSNYPLGRAAVRIEQNQPCL